MDLAAKKDWLGMFNTDIYKIWRDERKELRNISMLYTAIKNEFKAIEKTAQADILSLRKKLEMTDGLKEKKNTGEFPLSTFNKSKSPDIFNSLDNNIKKTDDITEKENIDFIDLSHSDEDFFKGDRSPTIQRHKKRIQDIKLTSIKCDLAKRTSGTPKTKFNKLNDSTVIENTPECHSKRRGQFLSKLTIPKAKKKKLKNNTTLTQLFPKKNLQEKLISKQNISTLTTTFYEGAKANSQLGITTLMDVINDNNSLTNDNQPLFDNPCTSTSQDETFLNEDFNSSEEVDKFSKGVIFDDSDLLSPSQPLVELRPCPKRVEFIEDSVSPLPPEIKNKHKISPEPEPVLRGHARKKLPGWSCEKCQNFYGQMNLEPHELQKLMDACSKHRYKYGPPEDTLSGYWDLSIK